jgi:hypothetical protein
VFFPQLEVFALTRSSPFLRRITAALVLIFALGGALYAGGGAEEQVEEARDLLSTVEGLRNQASRSEDEAEQDLLDDQATIEAYRAIDLLEEALDIYYERGWKQFLNTSSMPDIEAELENLFLEYIEELNEQNSRETATLTDSTGSDLGISTPVLNFSNFASDREYVVASFADQLLINGFVSRYLVQQAQYLQREEGGQAVVNRTSAGTAELTNWFRDRRGTIIDAEDDISLGVDLLLSLFQVYRSNPDHYDYATIITLYQLEFSVRGTDQVLSEIRLLLADALRHAREYSLAIENLSIAMYLHPQYFDDAEQRIAKLRDLRERYNELLGGLIDLLSEATDDDPDTVFDEEDEEAALDILEQLSSEYPDTAGQQTRDIRANIKLAVDRRLRDEIIAQARELIENQDYLAAIERYTTLSGLNVGEAYSNSDPSFELQKEEFIRFAAEQRISELYEQQIVDEIPTEVEVQIADLAAEDELWAQNVANAAASVNAVFLPDPSLVNEDVINLPADFSVNLALVPELNALFGGLGNFSQQRDAILDTAESLINLRAQLPSFLPEDAPVTDSVHLEFLQQFIAGPAGFEGEGIAGATYLLSRQRFDALLETFDNRRAEYTDIFDQAFITGSYQAVLEIEPSLRALNSILFQLFAYQQGGEALSTEDPLDFIQALQAEDRSSSAERFLEGTRLEGRLALAAYGLRYQGLAGQTFEDSQLAFQNYNEVLVLFDDLQDFSDVFLSGLDTLVNEIESVDERVAEIGTQIRDQHNGENDMSELVSLVTTLAIDYFNQYLVLEQEGAPGRYARAIEEAEQADTELAGIETEVDNVGVVTTETRFYAASALERYTQAEEDLRVVANISAFLNDQISDAPLIIRTSPLITNIDENSADLVRQAEAALDDLQPRIRAAQEQLDEANAFLSDARASRQDFETLLLQTTTTDDIDLLEVYLEDIDFFYSESLALNWDDDIADERSEVLGLVSLSLENRRIEVARLVFNQRIVEVEEALQENPPNYIDARNALIDAEEAWFIFNTQESVTINEYRERIDRAILLAGRREIPPISDSRYGRIVNDLNEAGKYLDQAVNASAADNETLATTAIARARSHIASVRLELPSNPEAAFIALQLERLIDEDAFDAKYDEWVAAYINYVGGRISELPTEISVVGENDAESNYNQLDDLEAQELLADIEALNRLRTDSRLLDLIITIEVRLGIREDPALVARRQQANDLVNDAESLKNQADRTADRTRANNLLNRALDVLDRAEALYPTIPRIPSLRSEIETLLGREPRLTLPPDAQRAFETAKVYIRAERWIDAKDILDQLWAVEDYRDYYPLRQERENVYNELGL